MLFVDVNRGYQANRRGGSQNGQVSNGVEGRDRASSVSSSGRQAHTRDFRDFLWPHIELAFNKGFDDNVGRNPVPADFEVRLC